MRRGGIVLAAICACLALLAASPAAARTILFVGNSFTFGAGSPVMHYHPERVRDLNAEGIGGVPALFKTFADEAGLDWDVSLETAPGMDLAFHLANKRAQIAAPWDAVILQGYSTLDRERSGDPTRHVAAAKSLSELFFKANRQVRVRLVSTWSRADQTYLPSGHWHGQPINRMAEDIAAANQIALKSAPHITGTIEVGAAWNRAMREGLADPNPYDGIEFGKISLWTWDQYHASAEGYYLEALMVFGVVTGLDPRTLGNDERAARDLGLEPRVTHGLQAIAARELGLN